MRPLCSCGRGPVAVNYYKDGIAHYRKSCGPCLRGVRVARWQYAGYKMKNTCDKCGFKSLHPEVFAVYHIDEDLNNCRPANLKTVCANCQRILSKEGIKWKQGDLVADF